jgi:hypothetical protein
MDVEAPTFRAGIGQIRRRQTPLVDHVGHEQVAVSWVSGASSWPLEAALAIISAA